VFKELIHTSESSLLTRYPVTSWFKALGQSKNCSFPQTNKTCVLTAQTSVLPINLPKVNVFNPQISGQKFQHAKI